MSYDKNILDRLIKFIQLLLSLHFDKSSIGYRNGKYMGFFLLLRYFFWYYILTYYDTSIDLCVQQIAIEILPCASTILGPGGVENIVFALKIQKADRK